MFTGRNEVVAKVMFLLVSVILLKGGSASVHTRINPPPRADHPPRKQTPPGADTPGSRPPPPGEADSGIRSMSGRYASYWNAFLFKVFSDKIVQLIVYLTLLPIACKRNIYFRFQYREESWRCDEASFLGCTARKA